jgi:DNA repair and recombination protein RAD54B
MIGKPFKPPLLLNRPSASQQRLDSSSGLLEPPAKKRRISSDSDHGATTMAAAQIAAFPKTAKSVKTFIAHRAPLGVVSNGAVTEISKTTSSGVTEGYYTVLWYA